MPPDTSSQPSAENKLGHLQNLDLDALADRIADRIAVRPKLLDLNGVASMLNVGVRTVETLVAAGEIPVARIGAPGRRGVRRFDPAAVEAYVRRQTRAL